MSTAENKTPSANRRPTAEAAETPTEELDNAEAPEAPIRHLAEQPTEAAAQDAAETHVARPRIRWGAIVWGLIVCAIAVATLSITRTAAGREDFALWLTRLTPGGIWLIVVLAAGGILLLLGLLSAIRRLQRR